MNLLYIIAAISLIAGLLMIIFSQCLGKIFCRVGKFVFCIFKPIPWLWSIITEVYNPNMTPKRFKILGAVFVAQAGVLAIFGSIFAE